MVEVLLLEVRLVERLLWRCSEDSTSRAPPKTNHQRQFICTNGRIQQNAVSKHHRQFTKRYGKRYGCHREIFYSLFHFSFAPCFLALTQKISLIQAAEATSESDGPLVILGGQRLGSE